MGSLKRAGEFSFAVLRRFVADNCLMRASALAYTSLLSMVPLLAVMFSVLKGIGVQRRLEPLLLSRLSLSPQTAEAIVGYIDQTNVATLGTLGAVMLLLSVISVLGSIEASFNRIWRVTRSRTLLRQVTDYLSVVLLTPFLLLLAVTLTSSLQVQQILDWLTRSEWVGEATLRVLGAVPVVINVVALFILYAFLPNRRPYFRAILIGSIAAGAGWHGVQWLYVTLQIGVASYNAIYGALSQIPVTLVWLYVSWLIVLAGAEIAAILEFGTDGGSGAPVHEGAVALSLLLEAGDAFREGSGGVDAIALARRLRVDPEVVLRVGERLCQWHWMEPIEGDRDRYVLGQDPDSLPLARLAEFEIGKIPPGCPAEARRILDRVGVQFRQSWESIRMLPRQGAKEPHR